MNENRANRLVFCFCFSCRKGAAHKREPMQESRVEADSKTMRGIRGLGENRSDIEQESG